MKHKTIIIAVLSSTIISCSGGKERSEGTPVEEPVVPNTEGELNLDQYPNTYISNEQIAMKLYLPDPENGLYRATRFDWSGMVGSLQYKGHEYFGYWKETHDPLVHEDLTGPVEGYIEPGLGFQQAGLGEGFVRIGVGVLEKETDQYQWTKTYKILDHGVWEVEKGEDWIEFTHQVDSDFGYAYTYHKIIRLQSDGFTLAHKLLNRGTKAIETDQFNHNFFMIDGEISGPAFTISFPYAIATKDSLKDLMYIEGSELHFEKEFRDTNLFLTLSGYSDRVSDHQVTVVNHKTGAGVKLTMDQPIHRMCFWACETTLCPENFIWISVAPGEEMEWTAEYELFISKVKEAEDGLQ